MGGRGRPAAVALLWLLATIACAPQHDAASRVARSPHGMVVAGSAIATDVGVQVLEAGGNAVDAAVASAFALAVVEPSMSGLGGRTQLLIRTADGRFHGIDGTTEVPRGAPTAREDDEGAYGYATIAIPGTVAALTLAQERFGTTPLADVMAPAIRLAEEGFRLPAAEAAHIAREATRLAQFPGSRRHFLQPDGTPLDGDSMWRQPDLARVLRSVARDGAAAFYRGWIAESIAVDMARHGGWISREDLAAYAAEEAGVVQGSYREYDLAATYLPASGATAIEALHILEQVDLDGAAGGAEWAALVAQALLMSFEDRDIDLATPGDQSVQLLSKTWAAQRAAELRDPRTSTHPSSSDLVRPHAPAREASHTTHLSVADQDGALVALTQSVGPLMGSRVATTGLGFIYAATMGYLGAFPPGTRPFSSQTPLIVLHDGRPYLVLGAAGARRIISAVVEVTSRVIDQELPLVEAMDAPRFHPTPEQIYMEVRPSVAWTDADLAAIAAAGFRVTARDDPPYFARVHGIAFDARAGEYVGVADERWEGTARGVRRERGGRAVSRLTVTSPTGCPRTATGRSPGRNSDRSRGCATAAWRMSRREARSGWT
jgi:gamma-glutamyltranspeptidase/glutathione hydrolase